MKKPAPAKKRKKRVKRPMRRDFSQNALAAVEQIIGGKLAQPSQRK